MALEEKIWKKKERKKKKEQNIDFQPFPQKYALQ